MNINYNFVFVFYDVFENRGNKIFKICKKYLNHYQKSVFKGEITPSNLLKLEKELYENILGKDFIYIIKMKGDYVFREELLCKDNIENNELII